AAGGRELVNCGRAWGDGTIAIVDPETLRERPPGQAGEIRISGSHVAADYWNDAAATRETFDARLPDRPDRAYLRTGDRGVMSGGDLHIVGRIKDLLIVNGESLHPQDIEHTIARSHSAFAAVGAAFGIDTEAGEQIVAVHEVTLGAMNEPDHSEAVAAAFAAVGGESGVRLFDLGAGRAGAIPLTTSGQGGPGKCKEPFKRGAPAGARGQSGPSLL